MKDKNKQENWLNKNCNNWLENLKTYENIKNEIIKLE